ncbi:MAG: flagellar biosynthesis protein FlhF, partial [Candidatus Parcubacteria bacterium]|nr:flagellar biosynthesis protein FlhF [Candidatus Parcubacteria bacterium]
MLTKPYPCPGRCLYCPSEKGIPKSYLSGEPAVERAKSLKYNPYWQVKKRIEVLAKNGHPTDKIELIVIGGTWSYLPKKYQSWFIKRCFDGANNHPTKTLEQAQTTNETAKHRIVGITLETRPDYITPEEIKQMRQLMKDQMAMLTWRDAVERNPLRGEVWNTLSNAGFSPLFARTVADKMPEELTESQVQDWLSNVLKRNVSVIKADEDIVERGGAWALVGPTGVGKTTTTAKLAARCVVKYGADSLGLITTDSYRIGAQDQLRIYGKILGVQVYTAQNDADLAQ